MIEPVVIDSGSMGEAWLNRVFTRLCAFVLAAAVSFTLALSAYLDEFRTTRVGAILVFVCFLHLVWHSRLIWRREFGLYACLVLYMFVALMWTRDVELAMNSLVPAVNCILVMTLFASMITYNHTPTVLAGALCGFAAGAAYYTLSRGFPFAYPQDFSYNAIAAMYLFGLFLTLMYSCFTRSSIVLLALAVIIMLHIIATTSIKTNLGIVLGAVAALIMYFRHFGRLLRRRAMVLTILLGALGYSVASNDALMEKMGHGVQRVLVGVKVLQARDDVSGYSAFEQRDYWKTIGIEGWKLNPVFGYGTESFRDRYGITSHSTPIDLLYNYGVIGLLLFYSVFASLGWRLLQLVGSRASNQRSLMLAGVVCYVFVSLSGTIHYNVFLAAFIGIVVALLTLKGGATVPPSMSSNQMSLGQ